MEEHLPEFDALSPVIRDALHAARDDANEQWRTVTESQGAASPGAALARSYALYSYESFEDYDSASFPMLYAAAAGEADKIEVIRISPEDAPSLIDVNEPGARVKVAGAAYHHFGAFLDRLWRKNDILWGRLDSAEVLIKSLMPPAVAVADADADETARSKRIDELVREAQTIIVREQLERDDRKEIVDLLAEAIATTPPG